MAAGGIVDHSGILSRDPLNLRLRLGPYVHAFEYGLPTGSEAAVREDDEVALPI